MTKTSALVEIVFELQDTESITNVLYDILRSYERCGNDTWSMRDQTRKDGGGGVRFQTA